LRIKLCFYMSTIHPQYTFDSAGNPVGVFLPIEDWNALTEELNMELPEWQKELIDNRLAAYKSNPSSALDWEVVLKELEAEDETA